MQRHMNNPMTDTTPVTRLFDTVILFATFAFNAIVLDADVMSILIAVGGSLSGAVMLGYFRRDARKFEQFFKVLASAIGGLVLGTVLQEYLRVDSAAYRLGLFFVCAMLALVVLRALLTLTEQNASDAIRGLLQRVFNLRIETDKVKRRSKQNTERIEVLENEKKEGN